MTENEYLLFLEYWISDLISSDLKESVSFEDWIRGFEDRYSEEQLEIMRFFWNKRSFMKNYIISHPSCENISLKVLDRDQIILYQSEIDLSLVSNFNKIKKELDFLKMVDSKFSMHNFIVRDNNFKFYHDTITNSVKELIDPLESSKYSFSSIYEENKDKYTYMQLKNIFKVLESFNIIDHRKVLLKSSDLVEPVIKEI